jgi:hypothetical protein
MPSERFTDLNQVPVLDFSWRLQRGTHHLLSGVSGVPALRPAVGQETRRARA